MTNYDKYQTDHDAKTIEANRSKTYIKYIACSTPRPPPQQQQEHQLQWQHVANNGDWIIQFDNKRAI